MIRRFLFTYKLIFAYGVSLAVLLFVLRWLELRVLMIGHAMELYVGAIALLFTGLGIWLTLKLWRPKVVLAEEQQVIVGNANESQTAMHTGLSKREIEVLKLMAKGLSNQEIAAQLFVSLNTIKTHSSNLFEKMEVKRRTQAVDKAKRLGIIS